MTAATNTGIGDSRRCVFHVTIVPGVDGAPSQVTDIVVKNLGEAPLTGATTITVSAEVVWSRPLSTLSDAVAGHFSTFAVCRYALRHPYIA